MHSAFRSLRNCNVPVMLYVLLFALVLIAAREPAGEPVTDLALLPPVSRCACRAALFCRRRRKIRDLVPEAFRDAWIAYDVAKSARVRQLPTRYSQRVCLLLPKVSDSIARIGAIEL